MRILELFEQDGPEKQFFSRKEKMADERRKEERLEKERRNQSIADKRKATMQANKEKANSEFYSAAETSDTEAEPEDDLAQDQPQDKETDDAKDSDFYSAKEPDDKKPAAKKKKSPQSQKVDSSWIDSIHYDPNTDDILTRTKQGYEFSVDAAGDDTFNAWANSPSKGKFFHSNIKGSHRIGEDVLGVLTPNPKEIADMHSVPLIDVLKQLKIGTEIEQEHVLDLAIAREIALDHLAEMPDYYTRLHKMENE